MGYNNYSGSFLDDEFHGIGRQQWADFTYEGEFKQGKRHGYSTVYFKNGNIFNMKYDEGIQKFKEKVTNSEKAWYGNGRKQSLPFLKFNKE